MASDFIYMTESGQKSLLLKVNTLRQELAELKPIADDSDLAMRIAHNVQAAKEEIKHVEGLLCRTIHYQELNAALGIDIINH